MIENSRVGLTLLESERTVVVTKEEFHQSVLAQYAPRPDGRPRHVAAELVFAPITYGPHAGERGIEVRLDGYRVGELTYAMAQRYAPVVEDVLRRGGRAGAEAHVRSDPRGLQIDLRLPKAGAAARPGGSPGLLRRVPKPLWIAAGVVGTLVLIGTANRAPVAPSASTSAPSTVAAAAPAAPSTQAAAPVTTVAPTTSAPTTKASPSPSPTPSPAPKTRAQPQPEPEPEPETRAPIVAAPDGCDPNYSGCVPIASDVDCQGGSGNGPAYVRGPVRVVGNDIYGLDGNDNDGIGCE